MKVKPKFIIRKKSPDNSFPAFFLGALYDYLVNPETGEQFVGFSLITTPHSCLLQAIPHPRGLLVVPNHKVIDFLDKELPQEELEKFFIPFDPSTFELYEVDPVIAKKNLPVPENDEKLILPISEIVSG